MQFAMLNLSGTQIVCLLLDNLDFSDIDGSEDDDESVPTTQRKNGKIEI